MAVEPLPKLIFSSSSLLSIHRLQLSDLEYLDLAKLYEAEFCTISKTKSELSIVISEDGKKFLGGIKGVKVEEKYKSFFVDGTLEMTLIGILAKLANCLAQEKIPIFVISTFDTDYVLVKEELFERAKTTCANFGYAIA